MRELWSTAAQRLGTTVTEQRPKRLRQKGTVEARLVGGVVGL